MLEIGIGVVLMGGLFGVIVKDFVDTLIETNYNEDEKY